MLFSSLHAVVLLAVGHFVHAASAPKYTLVKGLDNSHKMSEEEYRQAYDAGHTRLVIRGYTEGTKHHTKGVVDPHFLSNVQNAVKAGFKDIEAYWYPCSRKISRCLSYEEQLSAFKEFGVKHDLPISRLWLHLVFDKHSPNWDYGRTDGKNLAEAKKMVKALKAIDPNAGIYSNPREWYDIFGSYDVVLDASMPLWWSRWDDKHNNVEDLIPHPKFGGWEYAVAKQYSNESSRIKGMPSNLFNLDIFMEGV